MATDAASRWRWAARLLFLLLVLAPLFVQLGALGDDLPALDAAGVVRARGFGVVLATVVLLIWQKRRSRGRRVDDTPERREDRKTAGTGEVYAPYAYNNQQRARREGERIRERAEEISDADREARK